MQGKEQNKRKKGANMQGKEQNKRKKGANMQGKEQNAGGKGESLLERWKRKEDYEVWDRGNEPGSENAKGFAPITYGEKRVLDDMQLERQNDLDVLTDYQNIKWLLGDSLGFTNADVDKLDTMGRYSVFSAKLLSAYQKDPDKVRDDCRKLDPNAGNTFGK